MYTRKNNMLGFLIFGIISLVVLWAAIRTLRVDFIQSALLIMLAFVIGAVAVIFLAYELQRLGEINYNIRHSAELAKLRYLSELDAAVALKVLEVDYIRLEFDVTPRGIECWYSTQHGDLSPQVVKELLEDCLSWPAFPDFPPQHGLTGFESAEKNYRDNLRAFTALCINAGLAERGTGPNTARWLLSTRHAISELFRVNQVLALQAQQVSDEV
jgi:hypothetical protein